MFCKVEPSAASATQGPKELISASVQINVPAKSHRCAETSSMARSNTRMMVLVTAVLRPAVRFMRSSSLDRASVCSFICAMRFSPCPYCNVSERPRRESNTKPASSPDLVRNFMPSSPLSLDVTSGTITPTTM